MVVVRGRLTPEVGSVFRRALEAAVAADGRATGVAGGETARADAVDEAVGVERSHGQRQADALGRLAECALAGGLDRGTAGDRYQVVLHVDAGTLAEDAAPGSQEHAPGGPEAHARNAATATAGGSDGQDVVRHVPGRWWRWSLRVRRGAVRHEARCGPSSR